MQRQYLSLVLTVACLLVSAQDSSAIESCKVKVDRKTGVLSVDASGAGGPVLWGTSPGDETNAFFNDATCADGPTWKKCRLADPATLAAKTPPPDCTLYLDDGVQPCKVWIGGCVPGPREITVDLLQLEVDLAQLQLDVAALQATASTHGGAISAIQATLTTVQGDIATLQATDSTHTASISANDSAISALSSTVSTQGSDITTLDATVASQTTNLGTLNDKTQCLTSTATDAYITGCNLHIESGSGATDGTLNGLGNLIVGYNEDIGQTRTGSHNLVVGRWHGWTSWGGFIAGEANGTTAPKASVLGGTNNQSSGIASTIVGGYLNAAAAHFSSILGGASNVTNGQFATVSGGGANHANGAYSAVAGGASRTASNTDDWVAGALFQDF